jgi:pyruvate dehydrogenase E1 component alpha subunit
LRLPQDNESLMSQLKQSTAPAPVSQGNPLIRDAKLKQLYEILLKSSLMESRAAQLHKRRRPALPFAGREAAIVSAAIDLRREDWIALPPRDFIGGWVKGLPLSLVWSRATGLGADKRTTPASTEEASPRARVVPSVASIALQLNLATGVALGCKSQNKKSVTMAFFAGRLKASRALDETLTLAAAQRLPLIAVACGEYPTKATGGRRTKAGSQGDKFHPCGIPLIPVDGTDAVAMYRVAYESIHKARHGGGPTLIEALPGMATDLRPARTHGHAAVTPLSKLEEYLTAKGLFSDTWKQRLVSGFHKELDAAVKEA